MFNAIEGFSPLFQILREKHKTSFGILRIEVLEKFQNPFEIVILTDSNRYNTYFKVLASNQFS